MKTELPHVSRIKHGDVIVDIDKYLRRDYENIQQAADELPNMMCWLGEVKSWAVARAINAESAWKRAEAAAYFALKTGGEFEARGYGSKTTEDALKHAVQLDPVVTECAASYANFKRQLSYVSETIECFRLKIDLIRSSETTRRAIVE